MSTARRNDRDAAFIRLAGRLAHRSMPGYKRWLGRRDSGLGRLVSDRPPRSSADVCWRSRLVRARTREQSVARSRAVRRILRSRLSDRGANFMIGWCSGGRSVCGGPRRCEYASSHAVDLSVPRRCGRAVETVAPALVRRCRAGGRLGGAGSAVRAAALCDDPRARLVGAAVVLRAGDGCRDDGRQALGCGGRGTSTRRRYLPVTGLRDDAALPLPDPGDDAFRRCGTWSRTPRSIRDGSGSPR